MRTFYLFEIKENILKNYRNNYEELYDLLEGIHYLKTEDIVLGYNIYKTLVLPINKNNPSFFYNLKNIKNLFVCDFNNHDYFILEETIYSSW